MSRDQRKHDLHRTLVHEGFERDRAEAGKFRYVGKLRAAGHSVSVAITFPDLEFTRLPSATLLEPEEQAPNVVAHLWLSGDLCFARNEDYVLDRYNVGGTVLLCLKLAQMGIERALTHKKFEDEIANEFPQHWQGAEFYYDLSSKGIARAKIHTVPRDSTDSCLLLADNESVLKRLVTDARERRRIIDASASAVVLTTATRLTFKRDYRQPRTLADFFAWLASVCSHDRQKLLREISRPHPKTAALFINAPNGCVGITVAPSSPVLKAAQRSEGLARLLDAHASKTPVERYSGARIDLKHIFSRNMNNQEPILGKNIALVGCGTIGSHLAKLLLQSGAGHGGGTLLLLDNQMLQPGNVGRHFLGTRSIGEYKASALRAELVRLFSDANIVPITADAVHYFDHLRGYDLVIDATGEEALSFSINDYFVRLRSKGKAPDVLHVYLFGNGAAAQSLLVKSFDYACLKCQKPDAGGRRYNDPLRAEAKAVLTPAACGEGLYIRYGVAAPIMAAALALQVVLDWNTGNAAPLLRTIRIDPGATIEIKNKNPAYSKSCPACHEFHNK